MVGSIIINNTTGFSDITHNPAKNNDAITENNRTLFQAFCSPRYFMINVCES